MTKYILCLLLLMFVIVSCSDDDDNGKPQEPVSEKLVGIWTLETLIENGQTDELNECLRESNYQFFENNTFNFRAFVFNDDFDDCILATQASGDWELISNNNQIKFTVQEEENIFDLEIEDEGNQNLMTLTVENDDGDTAISEYVKQ